MMNGDAQGGTESTMKVSLFILLVLLSLVCPSHAIVIEWSQYNPDFDYPESPIFLEPTTCAYDFVVGAQDLLVTALGVHDFLLGGLTHSHDVAIWAADGTPVVSATVPEGTAGTMVDGFWYVGVSSPATLQSGNTYVIGTWYPDMYDAPLRWPGWDPTVHPHFESLGANSVSAPSSSLLFTSDWNNTAPFLGPSFGYNIVPEPSTYILFGLGGLTMAIAARRRLQKKE